MVFVPFMTAAGVKSAESARNNATRTSWGSNSGPMGVEDQRKDKYGSVHNQDAPQGLLSDETQEFATEEFMRNEVLPREADASTRTTGR